METENTLHTGASKRGGSTKGQVAKIIACAGVLGLVTGILADVYWKRRMARRW